MGRTNKGGAKAVQALRQKDAADRMETYAHTREERDARSGASVAATLYRAAEKGDFETAPPASPVPSTWHRMV